MFTILARHSMKAAPSLSASLLGLLFVLGAFGLGGCGDDDPTSPEPTVNTGFTNGYEFVNWSSSGIADGTTSMGVEPGTQDEAAYFSYDVNLGNPGDGVSWRTATFTVPAPKTGTVIVEWTYTGYHAFYAAYAGLTFFASQGDGVDPVTVIAVDHAAAGGGSFTFTGTDTLTVVAGEDFGITIGGSNFDSDSQLIGNLHVTRFVSPL